MKISNVCNEPGLEANTHINLEFMCIIAVSKVFSL